MEASLVSGGEVEVDVEGATSGLIVPSWLVSVSKGVDELFASLIKYSSIDFDVLTVAFVAVAFAVSFTFLFGAGP